MNIPRVLFAVASVVFIIIVANYKTPAQSEAAVFRLPVMLLACIPYYPKDGETLASWDFEQPVRLDFRGLKGAVTVRSYGTTTFHGGCEYAETRNTRQ